MAAAKKGGGSSPQAELKKRLEEVLKQPDNQTCADCPERGPRWASATLGTFICIKCSGIHRNLGVHISFVRSVNLDEWKVEHVEQMERWGNGRARAYYEAEVPRTYMKPSDWNNVREMTRWIKDKYEFKRFVPRDGSIPDKASNGSEASPTASGGDAEPVSRRERKPRDRGANNSSTNNQSPDGRLAAPKSSNTSESAQSRLKPVEPKPQQAVDLLDFSEPVITTTPPPPSAPNGLPANPQVQAVTDQFAAFGMQQQPQQQPQSQPTPVAPAPPQVEVTSSGKPKLSTEQLLSMFNGPQPPQPQMAPMANPGWAMGGAPPSYPSYPQQMGMGAVPAYGMPFQQPPQQQQPQQQPSGYPQQPQGAYGAPTPMGPMGGYPTMQQAQGPYGGMAGGYGGMPPQQGGYPGPQPQPQQYYGGYPSMGYPSQPTANNYNPQYR